MMRSKRRRAALEDVILDDAGQGDQIRHGCDRS